MNITFITGGARSGKSSFAEKLAANSGKTIYVATAQALDKEMSYRIKLHKQRRPSSWLTIEEPKFLSKTLNNIKNDETFIGYRCVLIDCLSLLVSNWLLQDSIENVDTWEYLRGNLLKEIDMMVSIAKTMKQDMIVVSNEVGMGVVPEYPLGRFYRDLLGEVNQKVSKSADNVFFTISGIPVKIK